MPLPDLSQLPPWAVVLFVISLAIIIGLAWLGERQGKRAPAGGDGAGRILGAVIDNKKSDELISAFRALAGELAATRKALNEHAQQIRLNTTALVAAGGDITDARTDIRELTLEIVRSKK